MRRCVGIKGSGCPWRQEVKGAVNVTQDSETVGSRCQKIRHSQVASGIAS